MSSTSVRPSVRPSCFYVDAMHLGNKKKRADNETIKKLRGNAQKELEAVPLVVQAQQSVDESPSSHETNIIILKHN